MMAGGLTLYACEGGVAGLCQPGLARCSAQSEQDTPVDAAECCVVLAGEAQCCVAPASRPPGLVSCFVQACPRRSTDVLGDRGHDLSLVPQPVAHEHQDDRPPLCFSSRILVGICV